MGYYTFSSLVKRRLITKLQGKIADREALFLVLIDSGLFGTLLRTQYRRQPSENGEETF